MPLLQVEVVLGPGESLPDGLAARLAAAAARAQDVQGCQVKLAFLPTADHPIGRSSRIPRARSIASTANSHVPDRAIRTR